MKIFLTGATGYIGKQLAFRLVNSGYTVHALVREPGKAGNLAHPNLKLFKGDVNDCDSIRKAIDGCERVFHVAAFARLWARPSDLFFKVNVDGTRNILEAAADKNISRFVYTSSTAVFGNSFNEPLSENDPRTIGFNSDYDLSKCMAERLVLDYARKGLCALIVNPSRVYGPGNESFSNPFSRLLKAAINGRPIVVPRCPEVVANYSYLPDIIEGHILAMKYGRAGERYILGGENISYKHFFSVVKEMIPGLKLLPIPKTMLKLAGIAQLLIHYATKRQPLIVPSVVDRYYANAAFSCEKAIGELNYRITPFEQGMISTINHLKNTINEPH